MRKIIEDNWDKFLKEYYHQPCAGCKDGHSSFWKTVIESDFWNRWSKEQSRRFNLLADNKLPKDLMCYDMDEVEELGIISPNHFEDFIQFIKK